MTATTTQASASFTVEMQLDLVDDNVLSNPDTAVLIIDDRLLQEIATAQAGILAMGLSLAEIRIPLNDDMKMFEDGEEWNQDEKEAGAGDFDPSSAWLKIEATQVAVEIWDEHGSAELHGSFNVSDVPGLEAALARLAPACAQQLINRLK